MSHLTHRYRGCRTAPAAPTGFVPNPDLQHATIPVGDAGGHDGSEAVCQTTTAATDPPLSRLSHSSSSSHRFCAKPRSAARFTIPVGDAGGHDGSEAVCQTTTAATDPPLSRLSHSSSSSHRGPVYSGITVGDAGGHDGTGRDSDEAVCQTTTAATEPPIRGCRTAPAAPTGVLCAPGLPRETPEAVTARAAIRTTAIRLRALRF
jgi:hypothetical protein